MYLLNTAPLRDIHTNMFVGRWSEEKTEIFRKRIVQLVEKVTPMIMSIMVAIMALNMTRRR